MKWIKASDKLPEHDRRVIWRWYKAGNPEWEIIELEDAEGVKRWREAERFEYDQISLRWLEETELPLPTSYQEQAEKHYPYDDTIENDSAIKLDRELTDMQRAAYLSAAQHFASEIEKKEARIAELEQHVAALNREVVKLLNGVSDSHSEY
jgi:hypothetical protein